MDLTQAFVRIAELETQLRHAIARIAELEKADEMAHRPFFAPRPPPLDYDALPRPGLYGIE